MITFQLVVDTELQSRLCCNEPTELFATLIESSSSLSHRSSYHISLSVANLEP